jgi:hypothetical protein
MQQADALTLRVLKTLNEAQARWYVARETLTRGRGGLKAMHDLTGLSRPTILKGIRELQQGTRLKSVERVRAAGVAASGSKTRTRALSARSNGSWRKTPRAIR